MYYRGYITEDDEDAENISLKKKDLEYILRAHNIHETELQDISKISSCLNEIHYDACQHDGIDKNQIRFAWLDIIPFRLTARKLSSGEIYILISKSVPKILKLFYHRLMASPNFIKHIGDPSLDPQRPLIKIEDYLNKIEEQEDIRSNCAVRRMMADLMSYQALSFLYFHEFSHHSNGHMSANQTSNQTSEYDGKKIQQALEMDADSSAVIKAINIFIKNFINAPIYSLNDETIQLICLKTFYNESFGKNELSVIPFFTAVLTSLHLLMLGKKDTNICNYSEKTHPHALPRMIMNFSVIEEHMKRNNDPIKIKESMNKSSFYWENIFRQFVIDENFHITIQSFMEYVSQKIFRRNLIDLQDTWAHIQKKCNEDKLNKNKLAPAKKKST